MKHMVLVTCVEGERTDLRNEIVIYISALNPNENPLLGG